VVGLEHREQAPVAGAEVEDARGAARHVLEQDALALRAARVLVGPRQVAADVLGGRPLLGGHAPHHTHGATGALDGAIP
jgi:hypothetical protein